MDAERLVEELAHRLYEQQELLEEARRAISLARAGGKVSFDDTVRLLRMNRERIMNSLGFFDLKQGSEDLFALVGYYLEVASRNEKEVLIELSQFVNVNEDLEVLDRTRQMAKEILERLF
ncbi:MAG: hypothetical protein ABDH61_00115 [Acidilobaceae archaeon]